MDWRKRKSSQVWDYFDHIAPSRVKCRICSTELSYLNRSTSSLYRHFRALHDRIDPLAASVTKSECRKQAMDQAVFNMVSGEWPESIVEDDGFRELLHLLEPSYTPPSKKMLQAMMHQKQEEDAEEAERELLNGARRMKVENLLAPLEFSPPTSPVFFLKQEPLDEEEEMEARNAEKREKAVPAEESRNPRVRFHQQFLDTYRKKDSKGLASGSAQGQGDGFAEPSPYEAESIIPSDVDSDSLLAPVRIKHDGFQGRSASQVGPSQGADSENGVRSRTQSRLTDPVDMPDYYQYAGTGLFSSPVSPTPFESNGGPKAIMDSATFWKNCNMAGCTEDFFTDLVSEMSRLSHRIQADQASQNDYDVALKLMEAGGRLALLVGNKQKELEERQVELIQAQTAMKTVTAALRR